MTQLRRLASIPIGLLDTEATDLEKVLGGPTVLDLPGKEDLPPVFVAILLHGNEVSGWEAVRTVLRQQADTLLRPLVLLVGNVAAAAAGVRRFEEDMDYNRVWCAASAGTLAHEFWQLREELHERGVEVAIDVHNTNGANPPHALCMVREGDMDARSLASSFAGLTLSLQHELFSCMEAFAPICPTVTIECGKPGDAYGIEMAITFLAAALSGQTLSEIKHTRHYRIAARVSNRAGQRIDFGIGKGEVIMPADADNWNFRKLAAGSELARLQDACEQPLAALDATGADVTDEYLTAKGNRLLAAQDIVPAMLTTDRRIVSLDCLCYLLELMPA